MMHYFVSRPLLVFIVSFFALWFWARVGWRFLRQGRALDEELRDDFGLVLGASLTLLGLIIGFSFSMATNRYDVRKNYEEAEANAIGTEYVRADLLPAANAVKARNLLKQYVDERIKFYQVQDESAVARINARTSLLQNALWTTVTGPATAQPTPLLALTVTGMNDVLNSQGYTQAAWWNRIPTAAWILMAAISSGCNLLVGYGSRSTKTGARLLPVLPFVTAIAFMLIADIDAPRHGIIQVRPQNLISLAATLK